MGTHGGNYVRINHVDFTKIADKHGLPGTAIYISPSSRFGYFKVDTQINSNTVDFTIAFHLMLGDGLKKFMYLLEFGTDPDREQIVINEQKLYFR